MITYNEEVKNTYVSILESIKYNLEDIVENDGNNSQDEFWETVHQEIDNNVSSNSREENLKIIDDTGHENDIDEGMIDHTADITMQIAQIAYCCMETEFVNHDFFQLLQTELNNNVLDVDEAKELLEQVNEELESFQ